MKYDELEKLNELKEKGVITEEEFKREKDKIFNHNVEFVTKEQCEQNIKINKPNDHNGYKIASAITLIVLGVCLVLNTGNELYGNSILVFCIPGLLGIVIGILKLVNKKSNSILLTVGIFSIVAALINSIGIGGNDLSIYGILSIIFGIIDIVFGLKDRKK